MSTPFRIIASRTAPRFAARSPSSGMVATAAAAVSAAALLGGCSGEARPFEESVEVEALDLAALEIVRPEGALDPLYVNAGQTLDFGLRGTNGTGGSVEISGEDRDWRVSDSSVASISDDGLFVARADGEVSVLMRVADVVATPFDVIVSTSSVESVALIDGPENLDPCVGADYRAEAEYADGSRRSVAAADIVWSSDAPSARVDENDSGIVTFSAPDPGGVQLTATVGEASLARPLVVGGTLSEIEIGPATLAAEEGEEQQLSATGTFDDGNGGTREETITEGVTWSISNGGEVASIGNEAGSRGLVSADGEGNATVLASCGEVSDMDTFEVLASASSGDGDNDDLAFDNADGNVLEVELADGIVELRVSTGDRYSSSDDVTRDATFSIPDSNQETVVLDFGNTSELPQLQLLQEGVVDIRVIYLGQSATLTVVVDS